MRLTADRAELVHALAAVLPAAGRPPVGLVEAHPDGTLAVAAGDGQGAGARFTLAGADVREPGRAAVASLAALAEYLRELPDAAVELQATGAALVVRGADARAGVPLLSEEPAHLDLPPVRADAATLRLADEVAVTLPADALRHLVRLVAFAADRREHAAARFALTGVLFAPDPAAGRLTLAATDGNRLAVAHAPAAVAGDPDPAGYLVPLRAAKLAAAGRHGGDAVLTLSPRGAVVRCGPLAAWTPLLSGRFPAWREILTRAAPAHGARLPAGAVAAALAFVAPAADEDDRAVVLRLSPGVLTAEARSSAGDARREVPLADFAGPAACWAFAGGAADDYLAAADSDTVTLGWGAAGGAVVLSAGEDSACVVMPLVDRPAVVRAREGDGDE